MTKIYNLIIASILMMSFASCDDFLDIQPVGRVIPRTAKEFREMLTQAYSLTPSDRGLATFRSDEFIMDPSLSKEDLNSYKDIWLWNDVNPSETTISFNWRNYYQIMFSANYTIESKDKILDGTKIEIDELVGESYMLRAYMHFLLVNLYGEPYTACDPATSKAVPLKMNSSTDKLLSRNTVGEIYKQILEDIDTAEKLITVENWDKGFTYRFNTISINALRSRVYLYMGLWDKSLKASEDVLKVKNILADLSTILPNDFESPEAIVSLERGVNAQYVRAGKVNPNLWKLYENGDLRKAKYYKQITASNIQVIKSGSDNFRCTFRVGEIYLNAAEAALENNENGIENARKYLLILNKARYNETKYTAKETAINAMTRDELRQEIYTERQRELAFEGHRWFDLRRTTRPAIEKTYIGVSHLLKKNDSRYTIRIPSEAIAANPELAN
ncbi:MAG: RagB/SusD family nutrient uptake outer membrane protein [Muribaculaceae bacterium]